MSVIPEVDDESDDNATDHPLSDPDTCSSSGSSISAGSNPALTHTTAHVRDTTGRRLLRRLRKFIRRFAVAPTKDASISPHQHIACSSTAVSSHPAGNARFHRQRS
ncbi:uncharacterized protein LOC129598779 isoform X2 [Paramacrobiotus metropolitanus]|uniref:uncharacterized protein LOC129598779 isoform X2 n=1 Tax=Paramacrobiotus metropolitanus TaxID=2943436 RepID=UPI0024459FD2|nr:uncharacterized protein LOC129598779 isoform X2 [Paramacrobiotus metropolitanus]